MCTGHAFPCRGDQIPPEPVPVELRRLYIDDGRTLEQIARQHHTSKEVVRTWLEDAQIPVQPRTSREHRKQLDAVLVAELYQEREWSASEIAANLDVSIQLVLRTLHIMAFQSAAVDHRHVHTAAPRSIRG